MMKIIKEWGPLLVPIAMFAFLVVMLVVMLAGDKQRREGKNEGTPSYRRTPIIIPQPPFRMPGNQPPIYRPPIIIH